MSKTSLLSKLKMLTAGSSQLIIFLGLLAVSEAATESQVPKFLLKCDFEPRHVRPTAKREVLRPLSISFQSAQRRQDIQMVLKIWYNDGKSYDRSLTKTRSVCHYDPVRQTFLISDGDIDVEPNLQGQGLSSIMRAIQILYTEALVQLKGNPFDGFHPGHKNIFEFAISAIGSHLIHHSHGFTSFGSVGSKVWSKNCSEGWDKLEFDSRSGLTLLGRYALTAIFEEMQDDRKHGKISVKTKQFEWFLQQKTQEGRARNVPERDPSSDSDSAGKRLLTLGCQHITMVMNNSADLWKTKGWSIDMNKQQPGIITVSRTHGQDGKPVTKAHVHLLHVMPTRSRSAPERLKRAAPLDPAATMNSPKRQSCEESGDKLDIPTSL